MPNTSTPPTGNDQRNVYDYRNEQHVYVENGIEKSSIPDTIHTNRCIHCGVLNQILVHTQDYSKWLSGTYIQDAFPWLKEDQREILVTGIHPQCWNKIFSED